MEYKLEPSEPEMKQMLSKASEYIVDYLLNVEKPTPFDMETVQKQASETIERMPENETSLSNVLEDLFKNKIPYSFPTTSPGFMAYIPGGGIFHSILGGLIARAANRYMGLNASAPFLSQVESDVIRWFCEMVLYPSSAGGILTSGGSIANLTAVITARDLIVGEKVSKGTVYASEYSHHSLWKAFHAAGIFPSQIRIIPVDNHFRIDLNRLRDTILKDKKEGCIPFMIIANGGSTNTGTVDPLDELASISRKFGTWCHVDAAYGGFFAMTPNGMSLLKGIELADSITLDPHKGLFLPYGTGALLVKDRNTLRQVFSHQVEYLPDNNGNDNLWDFSEMSLELTRPFRGLGIWLPFKVLGAGVFKTALKEKLFLSKYFQDEIKKKDCWEIIAPPELSLTVFRFYDKQMDKEELNRINQEIINHVNSQLRTYISGTIINGNFVLRDCILSFRTHREHVDWLVEDLNNAVKKTLENKI